MKGYGLQYGVVSYCYRVLYGCNGFRFGGKKVESRLINSPIIIRSYRSAHMTVKTETGEERMKKAEVLVQMMVLIPNIN